MAFNMKILTILGARPQFVKAAVVSREIAMHNKQDGKLIKEMIVHTGQHYDKNMSDIFFKEMLIPEPDYNLRISDCSHGAMTGRMLEQIEAVLLKEKPDVVLVYGDTNSTLAGALAAAKLHITVAHVEAGLRSFNMNMPEEINRILCDRISSLLFCPTESAVNNLCEEGIRNNSKILPQAPLVLNTGDVMYDATLFYKRIANPSETVNALINEVNNNFYLATVHREENTDHYDRLSDIVAAFTKVSKNIPIILPLHPRTRKAISRYGLNLNGVKVIDPVGYFDMIALLSNCSAVFTDSGGLQKEAYFFRKPCITLRDETEWVELVKHGYNILVGSNKDAIIEAERVLPQVNLDCAAALYGQGDAGAKIVSVLVNVLG
jgi:UDP-GlcNAc3NAcA epimerase